MSDSACRNAEDHCRSLVAETKELLRDGASIAESIKHALETCAKSTDDFVFYDPSRFALTRYHFIAGRLLIFKTLFKDQVSLTCRNEIQDLMKRIREGFGEVANSEVLDECLEVELDSLRRMLVKEMESVQGRIETLSLRELEETVDEWLLPAKDDTLFEHFGALAIGHPVVKREWATDLESLDSNLLGIVASKEERESNERRSILQGDTATLQKDRFDYPPELFPWHWVWLVRLENKPLHEIFGFDSEGVRKKVRDTLASPTT